jgi:predicted P-loop ATPase/GTPase
MNEHICAVCGETDIKKLTMFNYGVCLCHRCLEISAHSFIHDNAERKLKETEKKKESVDVEGMSKQEYESMKELKDEIAKKIWDEITEKIRKKREADAKKMAKSSEEIGKVIFLESSYETKYWNLREKHMNTIQRVKDLTLKMNKIDEELHRARKAYDSAEMDAIRKTLDVNRCNKIIDNLKEEFSVKVKAMNYWLLGVSALSGVLGFILGYCYR